LANLGKVDTHRTG